MDLFEALKERRSVRAYKDEQIKDEELNKISIKTHEELSNQ